VHCTEILGLFFGDFDNALKINKFGNIEEEAK